MANELIKLACKNKINENIPISGKGNKTVSYIKGYINDLDKFDKIDVLDDLRIELESELNEIRKHQYKSSIQLIKEAEIINYIRQFEIEMKKINDV